MKNKKNSKRGFTLIELLVVIVILSVLAALIVPKLLGRAEDSKVTKAVADLAVLSSVLETFRLDMGRYPDSDEGLYVLNEPPADDENWKGPYTQKAIPFDPWENEYIYEYYEDEDYFLLMSLGKDGADGGEGLNKDLYGAGE